MTELHFQSAGELAARLRRSELSSRELVDHFLARIEKHDGTVHAVVTLDAERARADAERADAALARKTSLGPLHGVPISVKDTFETEGMRTTAGSPTLAKHVPARDADSVARLRAAGAVILGKTNTPVFAADLQSYNPLFPTTTNPWDETRTPGGSSGGSAAAISAGLSALELGSDIGGSIRTPAHWTGVFGHKPTHGIVSIRGHIPGPPGTLAEGTLEVAGPIARSAGDLELALGLLAGPTDERALAWKLELPAPRRTDLRSYRVAAWLDDPYCPVSTPVGDALRGAVEALRGAGVRVDEQARPFASFAELVGIYQGLLWATMIAGYPDEFFDGLVAHVAANPGDRSYLATMARGGTQRFRDWSRANEARMQLRRRFAAFFRDFDVLLTPVNPFEAIPHDHSEPFQDRVIAADGGKRSYLDVLPWIAPATLCWNPATVAPIGRTRAGLPVGIQVVGPYLEDRTTIDFAGRLCELVGGLQTPPGY